MNAHDALADLVISSKLVPPDVSHAIHRPRLTERLDQGVTGRLTLVIGPAGSGKNWALSSWAGRSERLPGPLAWLTLDEEDNDPLRLCAHLIAALRGAVARTGGAAPLAVSVPPLASADSVGSLVTQLLNQLSGLPSPVVLVVENLHELTAGPASALLLRLVRHAPDRLRVVLSARTVPEPALRDARLRGELTEIRSAELAFRMPELRELLAARSVELSGAEAGRLLSGTGGQPLALRLALATLPEGDDGGTRSWAAMPKQLDLVHLRREVVDRLPEECREVLLRTSIVREACPSLAQALSGRKDAGAILHRLAAEYDLVTAVDPQEPGGPVHYRHHPIVRELLRGEFAERTERRGVEAVHLAACDWYRRDGQLLQAARQAVAAGRYRLGLRLVRSVGYRLCVSGRARAVLDVLESVPARRLEGDAHAVLLGAVARIAVEPGTDVSERLRRAEELFERAASAKPASAKPASATALIAFCRMVGDQYHGRVEASLRHAREAEEHLFLPDRPYQLDDDTRAAFFLPYFGEFQWWNGRTDEARESLRRGRAGAERAGVEFAALHSRLVALRMDIGTGRPGGDDCVRELLRTIESRGWAHQQPLCAVYLAAGWWAWWRHELAEARAMLGAFRSATGRPGYGQLLESGLLEAELLLAEGQPGRTRDCLAVLRARLEHGEPPAAYRSRLLATECRAALALGLVDQVRARLRGADIGPPASARIAVVAARARTLGKEPHGALDILRLHSSAKGAHSALRADVFVEAAYAHWTRGSRHAALDAVERALETAEPLAYHRPFADNGTWLRPLLRAHRAERRTHARFVDGLLGGDDVPAAAAPAAVTTVLLTPREAQVLAALPSHLKLADIAKGQYVTVNSIKTQVKSLYRKLGVCSRREAVEAAERLGLLE
ncbi:LuxR C-terminal-related transcriptional regulator [Streptomyces luteireticuli]|uniref:HTH luxR-type domain-containing protein n=1 Tax=Streptomyces luteireticuli TaxID=173858 RepID=A0ABN0YP00_9ACTN